MQPNTQPQLADMSVLAGQTSLLSKLEVNDSPFLSCYLDAQSGPDSCRQFIEDKAALIRPHLAGVTRLEFENALNMVYRQLEGAWHPDVKGMAIFARGLAGGRHLTAIQLAVPMRNSLAVYRAPEVLPLIALQDSQPVFMLLLACEGSVQVLKLDLGSVVPHAWPLRVLPHPTEPTAVRPLLSGSGLQRIHRLVSANTGMPLVVAADADSLPALKDCLPLRAASSLLHSLALPAGVDQVAAVDFVRRSVASARTEMRTELAVRLVRSKRVNGPAVTGQVATLEALGAGNAESLVIADGYDTSGMPQWEAKIELPRLACAQGVDVIVADSDELRYLGGVGCLLRQHQERRAMPRPAHFGQLDLVA